MSQYLDSGSIALAPFCALNLAPFLIPSARTKYIFYRTCSWTRASSSFRPSCHQSPPASYTSSCSSAADKMHIKETFKFSRRDYKERKSESELVELREDIYAKRRNLVTAKTSAVVGVLCVPVSAGMSLLGVAYQWRNISVEKRKLKEDRKSTRLNSSHSGESRMPSSA